MNKTQRIAIALLSTGLVLGSVAQARDAGVQYDYAKVVRATPITRTIEVTTPHQECWQEPVTYHDDGGSNPAGLIIGGIAGGIAGGVIGNRFGGGSGKKAATVAGAVLGAAVGNGVSRRDGRSYSTSEQRCETVYSRHSEERIVGYDVSYRYNGTDYHTRTESDPGKRIRVRVSVTPML